MTRMTQQRRCKLSILLPTKTFKPRHDIHDYSSRFILLCNTINIPTKQNLVHKIKYWCSWYRYKTISKEILISTSYRMRKHYRMVLFSKYAPGNTRVRNWSSVYETVVLKQSNTIQLVPDVPVVRREIRIAHHGTTVGNRWRWWSRKRYTDHSTTNYVANVRTL